jgi:MSHA biogenesis protein MshQ
MACLRAAAAPADYASTVLSDAPVGYWRFEETSTSSRAADASSAAGFQDGDYVGAVTLGQSGGFGVLGNSALFDGGSGHVQITVSAGGAAIDLGQWIGVGDASMEFCMKAPALVSGNDDAWKAPGVAGFEEQGGDDDVFWGWFDGSERLRVSAGNDDTNSASSAGALNDDAWHHLALVRDGDSGGTRVWVDGVLEGSDDAGKTLSSLAAAFSSIGRVEDTGGTPNYYTGLLDEVAIYDYLLDDPDDDGNLSDSRVQAHFASTP